MPIRRDFEYLEKNGVFKFFISLYLQVFRASWAETFGAFGPKGLKLLKKIGRKVHEATGEKRSMSYLIQNVSMAIQRANAVCVMGTASTTMGLEGLFNFVSHEI